MNVNQIVNMILRMVMRRALNKGVNAGINKAVDGGRALARKRGGPVDKPEGQPSATPERDRIRAERRKNRQARQARMSNGDDGR